MDISLHSSGHLFILRFTDAGYLPCPVETTSPPCYFQFTRKQAARWPSATSVIGGLSLLQRFSFTGQRG